MSSQAHDNHPQSSVRATSDRRRAPRAITVSKAVKINRGGVEDWANCRNISETGIKLQTTFPLSVNDNLSVEVNPGHTLSGRVVWTNGSECGVAFNRSCNSNRFIHQATMEHEQQDPRGPEPATNLPARVAVGIDSRPTTIRNISQRGMMIAHDGSFHPGLRVKVHLANGREREALVQWTHQNLAGLFLVEPYSIVELDEVSLLKRS